MDLETQYERLLRYCYMKTRDSHLAEDIVQETFVRFYETYSSRDTAKELACLYTIARNLCTDYYRRKKPELTDDLEKLEEVEALGIRQENEIEKRLDALSLEQALETLPEELREMLLLRYTNEMSVTDIGKIFGKSRFSVHRRLKQALELLKQQMEKGGNGI